MRAQIRDGSGTVPEILLTYEDHETLIVERKFSELHLSTGQDPQPAKALLSYHARSAVVVLGDPGAGKTTSFMDAAQLEKEAIYVTVRDFLTLRIQRYENKTLFLDALDEMRGRTNDGRTTLDQLRGRLDELGCPRFRLSCRSADWYSPADAQKLSDVSPDGTITVLKIEPLSGIEIAQIVSEKGIDHEKFLKEAIERNVYTLLENPQTLLMLLDVVGQGRWPDSRAELFSRAVEVLVREINPEHRRFTRTTISSNDLIKAAGYLSAILLCGGAEGVALDDGVANSSYISIQTLAWPIEHLIETVRRRLFRLQSPGHVIPIHRTVAEYLAAKFLSEQITADLPLKRVLAIITGYDGGTLSDLRGLFAWLACLNQQHANLLIPIDPLGIVLYGDASLLSPSSKRLLIDNLVAKARQNPFFRSVNRASRPFGALSSIEMEPVFRTILEDRDQHPIAVSCVVDAIHYGYPLPSLGDALLGIVRDGTCRDYLREDALEAFNRICENCTTDLLALLDDIQNDHVQDQNRELRAYLLRFLYPKFIGPADIVQYIIEEPESYIGSYALWIRHDLCNMTKITDIPVILDAIVVTKAEINRRLRFSYRKFIGQLLIKGLSHYGEIISSDRLFNWLGVALDQHRMVILEEEDKSAIRNWLEAHSELVKRVFEYWLSISPIEKLSMGIFKFWEQLQRISYPQGFAQWLIQLAVAQKNDDVANFLFREGVQLRTRVNREDAPSLDELFNFVDENPRFRITWQAELYCEIEQWRWEDIQRTVSYRQERDADRTKRIRWLVEHLDSVRNGTHIGAMNLLSKAYLGLFSDVDRTLKPRDRIASITNDECADAGLYGLVRGLRQARSNAPTPEMIAETNAKSRRYDFGFTVLAGMDILSESSIDDVILLPDDVLGSALAYHYAMAYDQERNWVNVILQRRVDVASYVLETYWRIHFAHNCEHISGLYSLPRDENMVLVAQKVVLPLLQDFPKCRENHLKNLLWSALLYSDKNELLILARYILNKPNFIRGVHRVLWYGVAFLLNPDEFGQKLQKYIRNDGAKAEKLFLLLFPSWPEERHLKSPELSVSMLGLIASIGGKTFLANKEGKFREHIKTLIDLINHIASFTDNESVQILRSLNELRSFASLHAELIHALDVQAKKRREAMFKYPSISQVVTTMNGGPPANPADLQALVTDYLLQLRDDISHGSTDGFKTFWNVDKNGKPLSPCPENTCRDRLLDRLRDRLSPLGLAAEPEGHYARDKRADIKVLSGTILNLPIEIKRHYHTNLWTAPKDQLQKLYSQDPGSGGRGIYLVFWFGIEKKRTVPPQPEGIQRPINPEQLEAALRQIFYPEGTAMMEIIVIDCSGK